MNDDVIADEIPRYVAWMHYVRSGERTGIEICDSDDVGAFKVYRNS